MIRAFVTTIWLAAGATLSAEPIEIFTVNYPLAFFAERVGGEHVDVHFPAPSDVDPAFWIPSTQVIRRYQQADLVLLNGANYARWTERASLSFNRVVDCSADFQARLITDHDSSPHRHGPAGTHQHGALAFTVWLDPELAVAQALTIKKTLISKQPAASDEFEHAFAELRQQLETLDARQQAIVATDPGRALLASHPVYQYLARRYGLNLVSVHWEPDREPSDAEWRALGEILTRHPARTMLWEGEPLPAIRDRLVQMNVRSLVYSPSGNRPADSDYLQVMQTNVERLSAAFH